MTKVMSETTLRGERMHEPLTRTVTSYLSEAPEDQPSLASPPSKPTRLRHRRQPLVCLPQTITEIAGPDLGAEVTGELDDDLTRQLAREPQGERIVVSGRVFDSRSSPPGPIAGPPARGGGDPALQAPQMDISLIARRMLHHVVTRIYFADDPEANAEDPVLASVPAARHATLLS
jgi:protocatechuate 3,4-dioxygenase beta subunit